MYKLFSRQTKQYSGNFHNTQNSFFFLSTSESIVYRIFAIDLSERAHGSYDLDRDERHEFSETVVYVNEILRVATSVRAEKLRARVAEKYRGSR